MKPSTMSDPEIFKRLDAITKQLESVIIRLDVTINLMFDLLSIERMDGPFSLTDKVGHLKLLGIEQKDIGRIVRRPSKDITSRYREYKARKPSARPRKVKLASTLEMNSAPKNKGGGRSVNVAKRQK